MKPSYADIQLKVRKSLESSDSHGKATHARVELLEERIEELQADNNTLMDKVSILSLKAEATTVFNIYNVFVERKYSFFFFVKLLSPRSFS